MADGLESAASEVVRTLRAAGCVFAEDEARLLLEAATSVADLDDLVRRRVSGLPLEHLLGWAEFCGLRIAVEPGVFVPRRRTEFLVEQAIALAAPGDVVVDLCCGSGALGAALAAAVPGVELHATDLDPVAVGCARLNLVAAGGDAYVGDLFAPVPARLRGRIAVLMANVPYVPTEAIALMPPEARDHEPAVALDGGRDGLDVLRRLSADAPTWLAPGGSVLVESSEQQAFAVITCFVKFGLRARIAESEDYGTTVAIGTRPSPDSPRC